MLPYSIYVCWSALEPFQCKTPPFFYQASSNTQLFFIASLVHEQLLVADLSLLDSRFRLNIGAIFSSWLFFTF